MKSPRCGLCGKVMSQGTVYTWHNKFLGELSLDCLPGEYYSCSCENELVSLSLWKRIEEEEQTRTEQALLQLVNNDFKSFKEQLVASRDLEKILSISRQAIHKNGRIKTKIFHVVIKGEMFYWYDSVMQFKETGEGRFPLIQDNQFIQFEKINYEINFGEKSEVKIIDNDEDDSITLYQSENEQIQLYN